MENIIYICCTQKEPRNCCATIMGYSLHLLSALSTTFTISTIHYLCYQHYPLHLLSAQFLERSQKNEMKTSITIWKLKKKPDSRQVNHLLTLIQVSKKKHAFFHAIYLLYVDLNEHMIVPLINVWKTMDTTNINMGLVKKLQVSVKEQHQWRN